MALTPAERQKAYRQRHNGRNGSNGTLRHVTPGIILDDNGRPSPRLTLLATNKLAGMNDKQALESAGFSRNSTQLLDKVRAPILDVMRKKGLGAERRFYFWHRSYR